MRVLVTGATGFVGACLTRRLVEAGHEVHILVRRESNRWRIAEIAPQLGQHEVDLRNSAAVEAAVTAARPEIIYHLATYGGFPFQKDTLAILESNFLGTVNLLRACEKVGFDCFVNTGSSSEYGMKSRPMREDDLLEPVGDYAVAKSAATLYCRSEAVQKDLPVITLRLFSPYGPWDDPKRLIPYVIKSLLRGEPLRLAKPDSVRDFVYIEDVLDIYLALVKKPLPAGAIFNVGSGSQHTIDEVVTMLSAMLGQGQSPSWGAQETQRPEPQTWRADLCKINDTLPGKPATSIQEGLKKTVDWLREHLYYYQ